MVNVHAGWMLVQRTWASWLQSRSFFYILAFGWMIGPLIYLFVWSTAAGGETIAGWTRGEFVAYYLILINVNQLTNSQSTHWTVGQMIHAGGLNQLLLYPMAPIFDTLASEAAGKVVYMSFVIPVTVVLALLLKPVLNPTAAEVGLFMLALLGAWMLRFLLGYALALLAFWFTRADALIGLQESFIFLLAGQIAPVALLPEALQTLAIWLPFRYMLGFPVEVLMGRLAPPELLSGFAIQLCWVLVALAASGLTWQQGLRRYVAVGG
jgi:ABC-2 type transport system permease protein